jgi:hypothetical protein
MATKYTQLPYNRQTGHKIYQHLRMQDPPKVKQTGIFGLKICRLATLVLAKQIIQNIYSGCEVVPINQTPTERPRIQG